MVTLSPALTSWDNLKGAGLLMWALSPNNKKGAISHRERLFKGTARMSAMHIRMTRGRIITGRLTLDPIARPRSIPAIVALSAGIRGRENMRVARYSMLVARYSMRGYRARCNNHSPKRLHAKSWIREGTISHPGPDSPCPDDIRARSLYALPRPEQREQERHLPVNQ